MKNPNAIALGRLGGKKTSEAKAAAARANGKKGGRPPKIRPGTWEEKAYEDLCSGG